MLMRWRLNLLCFGDDEARALGVDVARLRLAVIVAATLMTAAAVSISGVIGLVGLIVPHLARLIVGPNYRVLLPASALLGAGFLLAVDDVARILSVSEIPLGHSHLADRHAILPASAGQCPQRLDMTGIAMQLDRVACGYRNRTVLADVDLSIASRRAVLPARPERRRQDHAVQDDVAAVAAAGRRDPDQRRGYRRLARPRASPGRSPTCRRRTRRRFRSACSMWCRWGARRTSVRSPHRRARSGDRGADRWRRLSIDHLADRPYTEISGGERQLVLIARALAQQAATC